MSDLSILITLIYCIKTYLNTRLNFIPMQYQPKLEIKKVKKLSFVIIIKLCVCKKLMVVIEGLCLHSVSLFISFVFLLSGFIVLKCNVVYIKIGTHFLVILIFLIFRTFIIVLIFLNLS